MFYQDGLQSGIAKALQEGKVVACFVTDNGDESKLWENEFMQDSNCKTALEEHAVVLRLEAGSTEAGFLTHFCPTPKFPTFVIIRNGALQEYFAPPVTKDEFKRRLGVVLGSAGTSTQPSQPSTSSNQASVLVAPVPTETQAPPIAGPSSSSTNRSNDAVQSALAERSARLEAHKKEQEANQKAQRAAETAERKKKLEEAAASDKPPPADIKYALMQKKRQQEARDERARILKRVEDDKAARKVRAAEQRDQAQAPAETRPSSSAARAPPKKGSAECALQIRLFDGSTIRSRFPSQATLSKDVRPWIDEKQTGDQPYTFKQVLSPLPNKNIETSEEERSLESLDLTPNATLILLPVTAYSSAYAPGGGLVGTATGMVYSGFGLVGRVLGGIFGGGPAPAQEEAQVHTPAAPSANVRTLRDGDRRDDQQFYNGNALNFEPRRDDDDKKED